MLCAALWNLLPTQRPQRLPPIWTRELDLVRHNPLLQYFDLCAGSYILSLDVVAQPAWSLATRRLSTLKVHFNSASHCCFIASDAMPRTACRLHGVHLMSVIGCRACKQLCHPSKTCCVTQVRLQDVHDSPIPAGWEPLGTTEHCAVARAASSVAREPSTVPTSRNGQHCGQHRHGRASPLPARVISTAANSDWTLLSCGSSGSHDRSTEEWAGLVHSC